MNRRRFIEIIAASSAAGLAGCRSSPKLATFQFTAFGTEVHFQVLGVNELTSTALSTLCRERMEKLEQAFSLYRDNSEISQLNRDGKLSNASQDFRNLLGRALEIGDETKGLFDITVQSLWKWRSAWKDASLSERRLLEAGPWKEALARVDYKTVEINAEEVTLTLPGSAITLNGIAQGFAADEIVSLLKTQGLSHALVNIGEFSALGQGPSGDDWQVDIRDRAVSRKLASGRALAVSSGSGYTFDPAGRTNHLFRPADGSNAPSTAITVVEGDSATEADALATTLAIATREEASAILEAFPSCQLEIL